MAPEPHSQWQQFDDPSRDGWSSEVFAEAASNKLGQIGLWIENPQTIALEGLEEITLPQFRCKPLLPATKKIVFDSPYLQVERSSAEPEEGKVYKGTVVKLVDFGAFVNFFGKRDGLVHVSQIENRRLNHPSDVLKEGQEVWVKLLGFDDRGKVRLSMKVVNQETGEEAKEDAQAE